MAAQYPIAVRANRDYYLPVSVLTALGNPASLTNYLVVMTVKKSINDSDNAALYKSQPVTQNLPFGKFTFKIPRATSNSWWVAPSGPVATTIVYDVSAQDIASPANWATLLEGPVTVIGPVTRLIP